MIVLCKKIINIKTRHLDNVTIKIFETLDKKLLYWNSTTKNDFKENHFYDINYKISRSNESDRISYVKGNEVKIHNLIELLEIFDESKSIKFDTELHTWLYEYPSFNVIQKYNMVCDNYNQKWWFIPY